MAGPDQSGVEERRTFLCGLGVASAALFGGIAPVKQAPADGFAVLPGEEGVRDQRFPWFDVRRYGAMGDGVTNDAAAFFAAARSAAAVPERSGGRTLPPGGQTVRVPGGYTFGLAETFDLGPTVSLLVEPNARIVALARLAAVVRSSLQTPSHSQVIGGGGTIDAAHLADRALHVRYFARMLVHDIVLANALTCHLEAGDSSAASTSYELTVRNVKTLRDRGRMNPKGSVGLWTAYCTDSIFDGVVVTGAETGFRMDHSGHRLTSCHAWSDPSANGWMETSFVDSGEANIYMACYADTPGASESRLAEGAMPCGFRLLGPSATLIAPRCYNNSLYGTDDKFTGISIEASGSAPNPGRFMSIVSPVFFGQDTKHRLRQDWVDRSGDARVEVSAPMIRNVATVATGASGR